jgi:hypothetical protein
MPKIGKARARYEPNITGTDNCDAQSSSPLYWLAKGRDLPSLVAGAAVFSDPRQGGRQPPFGDIDVDGVELDEAAGLVGRQVARQTLGEAAFRGPERRA